MSSRTPTSTTVGRVSDEKTPLEQALDLFVYAPLGLFITVTEELPNLVEKGHQRLSSQLTMARMMGEMAAPQLQAEAEKMVKAVVDRLTPPPVPPRRRAATAPPARPSPSPAPASRAAPSAPATADGDSTFSRPPGAPNGGPPPGGGAGAAAAHLSIPGYDALSAMQVVQRLAGLDRVELEAVVAYESAHRGRKTILGKAEQLLGEKGT